MITINGKKVEPTSFPDGTSQVWKLSEWLLKETNYCSIKWDFAHEGEFMHLAQLKDLLDACGLRCKLEIPFLPYARQDKNVDNNRTFALYSFAKLLNSLNFEEIVFLDVHSARATSMIKNSRSVFPENEWRMALKEISVDAIVFPDQSALYKYNIPFVDMNLHTHHFYKDRDQLTGEIKDQGIHFGFQEGKLKSVLLVDDICDGGATFVNAAKILKEKGVIEVYLFVTHGLFTKGLRPLLEAGIKRIFTSQGEIFDSHDGQITIKRYQ